MNIMYWIILIGTVGFNMISAAYLLTEKLLEDESDANDVRDKKGIRIYSMFFIALNIGIALFLCLYFGYNSAIFALKRLGLLSLLWAVGYIDFKTHKIPNRFIVLGLSYRALFLLLELFFEREGLLGTLLSEGVAVLVLVIASILCSICVKNSIGYGDIKLFIVMGLLLGFSSIWNAIFVSLIITFITSVILLITRKKTRKDAIPFAPFLMVGTYISIIITGM